MEIRRSQRVPALTAPEEHFSGPVMRRDLGVLEHPVAGTAAAVTFDRGARTNWHRHAGGQLLLVVAGRGLVAVRGAEPQAVAVGDLVLTGAGEEHWHGASSDAAMTHVALSYGQTTWLERVRE